MTPEGRRRAAWLAVAAAAGVATWLLPLPLAGAARAVLAILVGAMVLWVAEALPLAVTALGSSLLLVLAAGFGARDVFAAYFDPVVVLLMGGFFLGVALQKHGLDVALAALVLRRAGQRPTTVLLVVMAITAVFSMWVSNTATTAIMLPIALGIVATQAGTPRNTPKVFALGVAAAANIGGVATPIGTTANPIALRFLADAGHPVSFLGWMARALPLAVVLVLLAWWVLCRVFPPEPGPLAPRPGGGGLDRRRQGVMAVFFLAVALWVTTDLHGVAPALVALGAALALFVLGLLREEDIPKAGWGVLLLIGGGIALGDAAQEVGLDASLARLLLGFGGHGEVLALLAVAVAAVALTLVSSNTAAAVVLVPIALRLAGAWDVAPAQVVLVAAVGVSFDFLVPMGTPPNAMARATGLVDVREMMRAGAWITLGAILLLAAAAWLYW